MYKKLALIIIVFGALAALIPHKDSEELPNNPTVLGTSLETLPLPKLQASPELADHILPPVLTAKAGLAVDLNSQTILYAQNFDEKLPIASLTKLMTALVVMEKLNLNQRVRVNKLDTSVIGSSMGLLPDEQITVRDLLKGLLIASSNDAALVLARAAGGSQEEFVKLMNAKSRQLNLNSTSFTNPVGYDHKDNYSTADDLVKIVNEFLSSPVLSDIVQTRETVVYSIDKKNIHKLRTTNKLLLEDSKVTGIKTGFTSGAQGNLIIRAKEGDKDVVTVILGSSNREEDSRLLLDWLFKVYRW